MMARSWLVLAAAGALVLSFGANAIGAPRQFCKSYAKMAVAQNEENRENGCGFTGGAWQSNLDNHFAFCASATPEEADALRERREVRLKACRAALIAPPPAEPDAEAARSCQRYARVAVQQFKLSQQLGCGFAPGGLWQSSRENHYNWCLTVPAEVSQASNRQRDAELQACRRRLETPPEIDVPVEDGLAQLLGGPRLRFCRAYADESVRQQERNEWLGCGLFGNRWTIERQRHFDWCMANPRRASLEELDLRKQELAACRAR
jgi:hypothetical protein